MYDLSLIDHFLIEVVVIRAPGRRRLVRAFEEAFWRGIGTFQKRLVETLAEDERGVVERTDGFRVARVRSFFYVLFAHWISRELMAHVKRYRGVKDEQDRNRRHDEEVDDCHHGDVVDGIRDAVEERFGHFVRKL